MDELKALDKIVKQNDKESGLENSCVHIDANDDSFLSESDFADDEGDASDCDIYNSSKIKIPKESSESDGELKNIPDIDSNEMKYSRERRNARARRRDQRKRDAKLKEQALDLEYERLTSLQNQVKTITESSITTEERIAEANVKALVSQLEKVDELLETLQEEVWADEEENEGNRIINTGDKEAFQNFSLLDQILAMVLLTFPNLDNLSPDAFIKYKKQQHEDIVKGWKSQFGYLPTAFASDSSIHEEDVDDDGFDEKISMSISTSVKGLSIGASEDVDDWEELADDQLLETVADIQEIQNEKKILRPGGGR